jgi:hypothetical protein
MKKKNQENENQIQKKNKDYGTKNEIEKKKTLRVKSYISSNFELKGKIEKKNQIHKRIQNKNKIQENEDQI